MAMVLNGTILGSFLERKDISVRDARQVSRATLLGASYHVDAALCAWTIGHRELRRNKPSGTVEVCNVNGA